MTGQPRERRMSAEPDEEVAALLPCCGPEVAHISTFRRVSKYCKNASRTHLVHPQSRASRNNRRRRAHVERVMAVSSRSNNVADGPVAVVPNVNRQGMLLHDLRAFGNDSRLAVLSCQSQRREERSNLRRVCAVGFSEVVEGGPGVVESEGRGVQDELLEQYGEGFGGV